MSSATPASGRLAALLLEIARPLLPAFPFLPTPERERVEDELRIFLVEQVRSIPSFLRLPYLMALLLFEWVPLLRYGRPYTALPRPRQERALRTWSRSPFGPCRDLVKLVRSCALFFYLDHPLVHERLRAESRDHGR
jgi:hypothetical protein